MSPQIEGTIAKLLALTQRDQQRCWFNALNPSSDFLPLDDRGYVIWSGGGETLSLQQTITQPAGNYDYGGLTARLKLVWWADRARLFVDGEFKQEGDLFDSSCRLLLAEGWQPGQTVEVRLDLTSPNHDRGGLMKAQLIWENEAQPQACPHWLGEQLTILHRYLQRFCPEKLEALGSLLQPLAALDCSDRGQLEAEIIKINEGLEHVAPEIKQRTFHLLGHGHLDLAWLWPVKETWGVGEATFRSVINLQRGFPELTFGHTSPVLYQWIKHHRPPLWKTIKQAVEQGQWELLAGMWVEPDTNLVAGESLARQLLYGQRFYLEEFGQLSLVGWLPDSFGFSAQLPQLLTQAGIDYFVSGKLQWGDGKPFPHGVCWWESPDGSRVLMVQSPPNVAGVMDTDAIAMANYWLDWEGQTGLKEMIWLPGVGDHGGGPPGIWC
ncbi:MAG: hypothetical protein HC796_08775 [Synechococcaceae cyanobacterium RL_1_2]|nr:hypothetical protein [Synechococcaceae cyanobacterium RL_1_2]